MWSSKAKKGEPRYSEGSPISFSSPKTQLKAGGLSSTENSNFWNLPHERDFSLTWTGWQAGWCSGRGRWWECWRRGRAGRWNRRPAMWAPQPGKSGQQRGTNRWDGGSAGDAPERWAPRRRWTLSQTCTEQMESPGQAKNKHTSDLHVNLSELSNV